MRRRVVAVCVTLVLVAACDRLPGRPRRADRYVRPSEQMDFATLYGENCAGCHGGERAPGAAVRLADPTYLALVDDVTLVRVISDGVPGTAMPSFARRSGGSLTDAQVDVIAREMRSRWSRPDALGGAAPPPYAAAPGDASRGTQAYAAHCAACHGPGGTGGDRGGSIVDGSYLALVSDQGLRTALLVGRPVLGMPDWRGDRSRPPMSAQEIADLVAWLIARRPAYPGQPYPSERRSNG